ncbi:hypothetical protein J8N05_22305 [Streptomyces sp. BH-SS-21]|uniref:Uncharacterized protein n=1 Tax=Streptomyces liliiviolaceus TaxID=2823109 RepID=A0A940Y5E2_9ACTN|nr:hypothetical protein [Streptomyces liliiviolaceus]MBQ0850899.1 hypothetical protein [Streptomyces liliiviolaceus]
MESNAPWSPAAAWDWMEECARSADSAVRGTDSWVPPVAEELVLAARASALSQWYPFTSHNHLRFEDSPAFWMPGALDVNKLAGSISFDTGGPQGRPFFRVWSGLLLQKPDPVLVLSTANAVEAVAALVGLAAAHGVENRP